MASTVRLVGAAAALVAFVGSCATYTDRTEAARAAVQRGDLKAGVRELNHLLDARDSDDLPRKWKKNMELVVLERASMLQALGLYQLSSRDFEVADKRLELLDIARDGAGKLGKYVYSDSATKYKTSPTEKLSLNAMNMCNYLARGDLDGAKIEAKRFTVMRKYLSDYDPEHEHGAFGSYLAGFVYERLGSPDEALRYYEEALQEREFASLKAPIARLAAKGTYRGERIKDYLGETPAPTPEPKKEAPAATPAETPTPAPAEPPPSEPPPPVQKPSAKQLASVASIGAWDALAPAPDQAGELLVVAKTGRVPYKVPRRIPIGLAIGMAGTFITGDPTILQYSAFKVLTYPELVPNDTVFDSAEMRIDGVAMDVELATDLTEEIVREYEDIKPKIIGAAITRMIVRAAAAEAGRAAGNQAEGQGALIGFLAAAAIEGTLVALDRPDTRSWTTLSARIFFGRTLVPPGKHHLEVTVRGPGGWQRRKLEVKVPAGGFVVVDVTTLR